MLCNDKTQMTVISSWGNLNLTFAPIIKSHLLFLQHKLWPQWKPTHEGNSSEGTKMPLKDISTRPRPTESETAYSVLWGPNLWHLYAHCDVLSSYTINDTLSVTFLFGAPHSLAVPFSVFTRLLRLFFIIYMVFLTFFLGHTTFSVHVSPPVQNILTSL